MATKANTVIASALVIKAVEPIKLAEGKASNVIAFTGRGAKLRKEAFDSIAYFGFSEETSRIASIDNLRQALGDKATDGELAGARLEWIIGRVAARMPLTLWGPDIKMNDKLMHARKLVCHYAYPVEPGKTPRALRTGQLGRRSPAEQKILRAAEEAWSQVKTEVGYGAAIRQADRSQETRDKAKRAPGGKVSAKLVKGSAVKKAAADIAATKPVEMTPALARQHIVTQAAALLMFCNKHAKHLPTDFGTMTRAYKSNIDAAEKVAKAAADKADAIKAEQSK